MSEQWYLSPFPTLDAALTVIEKFDHLEDYETRNAYVLMALLAAHWLGYPVGFRVDPEEPEWAVAFIELPTGQVSWHLPQHPQEWDGHTTTEKYERCFRYRERPKTDPWAPLGGAPLTQDRGECKLSEQGQEKGGQDGN